MYNMFFKMYTDNGFRSEWLQCIFDILNVNGLGYIWYEQNNDLNVNIVKAIVKDRLLAQFYQEWRTIVNTSSKCIFYKHFKKTLELEKY